ncbi:ABC transporter substrate-binding protein [Saccharibacillus sp. CPCC 101409]|uniref:ABC transporter substrate-binding protein n=1 Tax=Saccharibacillus sp. CPCC 101409 TaxID=3058041 RepID=UPI002671A82B|nr:ABC transporter substrate-binding protein [Saccharibacillus sp. CPCC 101409]MDO3411923.1 ABC transporter substrate-binding protein [Saccharibacillus sp. CPCC 101409]
MKKAIALVLVAALSALTACSNNAKDSKGAQEGSTAEEIPTIVWQYPTPGNLGSGFQEVEDAFNAMLEKDVGARVKFEPVGLSESTKKASLAVASGEPLDIMLTAFTSLGPSVDSGMIVPLDDLLEQQGKDIKEQAGVLLDGAKYDSKTYGVPPVYIKGNTYGYLARTDLLQKYNITIDPEKKYTMDDLDEIFAKVKAGEGKDFYTTIPWNTTQDPLNNSYIEYDKVTGSLAAGVLMLNRGFDDTTVSNLFATDEYATYVNKMYDWAKKGYISSDAAITKQSPDSLLATKKYLGMFYWNDRLSASSKSAASGIEFTGIPMIEPYVSNNGGQGIMWNITSSSQHPEKAMEVLNYIYKNKDAAWLLQFGLEGKSYKVLEQTDEGTSIEFMDPDTSKLPYYQGYGIYGNRLQWPVVSPEPINKNKVLKEDDDNIPQSRYSPALGYSFKQASVSSEIAAVSTVIEQYTPAFNSGALEPSKSLPEFLNALKSAGIDKIIQENQKQLDEWKQSNGK